MASEGPPNPTHSQGVAQVGQDTVLPVSPAPAPRTSFGMPGAPSRRQPERPTFQNAFAAAGHWASPSPGSPLCRLHSPEGRLWGCHPFLQALPTVPPPCPQSQASRQHKGYRLPFTLPGGTERSPRSSGPGLRLSGRGVYLESSTDRTGGKESRRVPSMGAACFPALARGLTARGLRCLSPPPRAQPAGGTPRGHLAPRVPSPRVVGATLRGRALVPGGLAQAARRVIMVPLGRRHLVLSCPWRAGAQAGLGHPSHWRQAEQGAKLVPRAPHIQAAAGTGREAA